MKKFNFSIKNVVMSGFVLGFTLISINTSFVNAQTPAPQVNSDSPYTVLAPLPCIESPGITCKGGNGALQPEVNFQNYVQYTVNLLIGLSAVAAVVMIIWNGIEYMYSNSFSSKKMSLDKAQNALIGLVLIFTSYIILRTIDPRLVQIPNSLVPQIEVKSYLASDALGLLTNTVLTDVEKTTIRGQEIAKVQLELRDQVSAKEDEFFNLRDQVFEIDALDPNATDPDLQKKRAAIIVKQLKLQEEIKLLTIKREIESAKGAFNGLIHSSQSEILTDLEDVKTQIQGININRDNVEKIRVLKKETIKKLGEVNFKLLDEEAKYAKYVIDSYKLKLVMSSMQEVSQNDGANYIQFINMEGLEDKKLPYRGKTENETAAEYIQTEIAKIIKTQTTLTIPELKNQLQIKVDELKSNFEGNKILNPTKK